MRVEDLIDAIGAIDPVYVEEAENLVRVKESRPVSLSLRERIRAGKKVLLPLAACLCLIAAGSAYGLLWDDGMFRRDQGMPGAAAGAGGVEESADAGVQDQAAGGGMEGSADGMAPEAGAGGVEESADGRIVINEVEELCSVSIDRSEPASVQRLRPEELHTYFGVSVLPSELPEGYALTDVPKEGCEISYDGDGRVSDDHILLTYEGASDGGSFTISVRTTESGNITSFAADDLAVSQLGGNDVTIAHYMEGTDENQTDGYLAVFEKKHVIFTVQSRGMEEDDVLLVLRGLQD
ncbi:MAG: DUF4367 domain-containing protein [Roseburia sp.]|nr:DUF4367 domain-containing protein [Roseburia sp.]